MTWPDQKKMTKTKTNTMTKTNTSREHRKRAIPETCVWPLRHLIRVMSWQDLTKKKIMTKTKTKTNTFGEFHQRAILETCCDHWYIWPEWWGDLTWQKIQSQRQIQRQRKWEKLIIDLWHLRHWLQLWQLRTWIHDNLFYPTTKSDTGQHSQLLQFSSLPFHYFAKLYKYIPWFLPAFLSFHCVLDGD